MIRVIATSLAKEEFVEIIEDTPVRYEGFVISETLERLLNRSKGEIMVQFNNCTVVKLWNGTVVVNEDVPDWEPAHITRLLDIGHDYVEIQAVQWSNPETGDTNQGTLLVFESERFADSDRVFVEYLN